MKEKDYIIGLLKHDDKVLRAIYKNFSKSVFSFIQQYGGTSEDSKDVFQDALMIIYKKAQHPEFELSSKFYTYLFSICKLIWYARQRKKINKTVTIPKDKSLIDTYNLEEEIQKREQHKVFQDNLEKLTNECQRLLKLFFEKESMEDITNILQYKNEHTTRTRKYRCQEKLKQLIKNDNRYNEIKE